MTRRAAVIGAGPAGLAAAQTLVRQGWLVDVLERGHHLGGMARSVDLWGETIEAGPHVLSGGDPAALALWSQIVGKTRSLPLRRAMLRRGRFIEYPPTIRGLARGLDAVELIGAAAGMLRSRLRPHAGPDTNARDWFIHRHGQPLYDAVLRNYIGKLWGGSGDDIDASYLTTVSRAAGAARKRHSAREIQYPVEGLGAAWTRLADGLKPHGRVLLGKSVSSITTPDGVVRAIDWGSGAQPYDVVISTAPISALLRMMEGIPDQVSAAGAQLRSRHIALVHLRVRSSSSIPFAWVFIDDPRIALGRVSDSRFWRGEPNAPSGTITMEYWCDSADPVWSSDDPQLQQRAEVELRECGVLGHVSVEAAHVMRFPNALPVPRPGHRALLDQLTAFVSGIQGLYSIGRQGTFELDSTLSAMAGGIATAHRVERDMAMTAVPSGSALGRQRLSTVR